MTVSELLELSRYDVRIEGTISVPLDQIDHDQSRSLFSKGKK